MQLSTGCFAESPRAPSAPLSFAPESIAKVIEVADRLGAQHWREFYGATPYVADLQKIAKLEADGGFAYFVARDADGEIVGHVGFIVFHSPFHGQSMALDVFYYVEPAHRGNGAAGALLHQAASELAERGISPVVSCMAGSGFGAALERAGFELSGHTYRVRGS